MLRRHRRSECDFGALCLTSEEGVINLVEVREVGCMEPVIWEFREGVPEVSDI